MNKIGRIFKRLRKPTTLKERDLERHAIASAAELSAKFSKGNTRQQRRRRAFDEASARTRKEIGGEPRPARRKIARRWAKQALKPAKAKA